MAEFINESKRKNENVQKLSEIQNTLTSLGEVILVTNYREYKREAYFSNISITNIADVNRDTTARDFYVYLFNDSILLSTPASKSGYNQFFKLIELLDVISIKEDTINMENSFQIVFSENKNGTLERTSFTFTAKSPKEREDWIDDVKESLSDLRSARVSNDGLWQIEPMIEKEDLVPVKKDKDKDKKRKNRKTLSGGPAPLQGDPSLDTPKIKTEADEIYLRVEIPGSDHTLQKTLKFESTNTTLVKVVIDTIVEKSPVPIPDKSKYSLYLKAFDSTEVEVLSDVLIAKTFKNMDRVIFRVREPITQAKEDTQSKEDK